jgi:hypothetical protein
MGPDPMYWDQSPGTSTPRAALPGHQAPGGGHGSLVFKRCQAMVLGSPW